MTLNLIRSADLPLTYSELILRRMTPSPPSFIIVFAAALNVILSSHSHRLAITWEDKRISFKIMKK